MDIFAGANLTVEVGTHTPGSKTPATDFEEIPEIGAFYRWCGKRSNRCSYL